MVWQPNILNNCYELAGGYAPPLQTTHQGLCPWTPLGDFRSPDPLCHPPPNPGYATVPKMTLSLIYRPTAVTFANNYRHNLITGTASELNNRALDWKWP